MADAKRRRTGNKPWKHIYGVDRKYTARVDRLTYRTDTTAMVEEIARYSTIPSAEFTTLDEFTAGLE